MISGHVVEELVGAGWICDDVKTVLRDGQATKQELWRRGKVVEIRHLGRVLKVLSGEDDCLQSLFVNFEEAGSLGDDPFVVIREHSRLRVYSSKGEEYLVHLPIPVKKIWKSAFGLVLEAAHQPEQLTLKEDDEETPMPNLLALHHPLDDFSRAVTKKSPKSPLVEWKNKQYQIIMVSEDPSLVVSYDKGSHLHTVWRLRKCTEDDLDAYPDVIGTPMMRHCSKKTSFNRLTPLFDTSKMTPNVSRNIQRSARPTPNVSSTNISFDNIKSGRATPNVSSTNISINPRSGKPTPNNSFAKLCRSSAAPGGASRSRSRLFMSSLMFDGLEESRNPEEPLPPDISLCLEHLWTEPLSAKQSEDIASKVFLCHDFIGQAYLCFLVGSTLDIVKWEEDNISGTCFGLVKTITEVEDASACEKMMIVLDKFRKLNLYTGAHKICGVHFQYSPTAQVAHIADDIATLHLDSKATLTGMPVTSSRPSSALDPKFFNDSSLMYLSPVSSGGNVSRERLSPTAATSSSPTKPTQAVIKAVHTVVKGTALLEYDNGVYVRLALPKVHTSSLIGRCLQTLEHAIPSKEACQLLFSEWYCIRNSPGPSSISNAQEWIMFAKCLMQLLGYHTDLINFSMSDFSVGTEASMTSPAAPTTSKRMRHSDDGCDGDWQKLLSSQRHHESGKQLSFVLGLEDIVPDASDDRNNTNTKCPVNSQINTKAPLFVYFCQILEALHLLYEDSKLNKFRWKGCSLLASLLSRLSADLRREEYVHHYWKDFPSVCHMDGSYARTNQFDETAFKLIAQPKQQPQPFNVFKTLLKIIKFRRLDDPVRIIPRVTNRTRDILVTFAVSVSQGENVNLHRLFTVGDNSLEEKMTTAPIIEPNLTLSNAGHIVDYLVEHGYSSWTVSSIPIGFTIPILSSLFHCRLSPPPLTWQARAYDLIGRPELRSDNAALYALSGKSVNKFNPKNLLTAPSGSGGGDGIGTDPLEDGLEDVENEFTDLRWPTDRRVAEVRKFLQSSRPVIIGVQQRPEVSDHDFVEEQERSLQSLCIRTMALPVGRGAMGYQTATPLPTEPVSIPRLCLSGKAPARGTTIEMDHIEVVPHMDRWPSFHNGVAAGLRIPFVVQSDKIGKPSMSCSSHVDSNWITFNKPKDYQPNHHPNDIVEHGGFLMALGLNGHLAKLGKLESFDYLIRGNEMISIGLLLGLSAAKRGSMDLLVTKKISTQLEALLPSTATELPLSHTTQVAGLIGLGLLYQGTGHRHMAEVCLNELGRPPGPEMENCTDRESYSLAAGLALGMITLGQGETLTHGALCDLGLPESLYYHMVGGPRPDSFSSKHKFRSPSYQVQEGDTINIDVTSPGATLALGLMFFRSNNERVASWLEAPDSRFLLEFVRPDFLMLRTLAKGLIMWDSIAPTLEWLESHVPPSMKPYCLVRPVTEGQLGSSEVIDYETVNQAYCNLLAGAAMALGLRFAGSANNCAAESLNHLIKKFLRISKRSVAELAGKATMEQTICILVLSLCIIMAGTGDLNTIRLVRYLRSRVGPSKHSTVTYGSHMALHLGLGLLFLGGGKFTLNTRPESVAAMVAAFFPKFPTHSNDNRYHLQALRHLYVLAAEPRILIPREVKSGKLVKAKLLVTYAETKWYKDTSIEMIAPILLPEKHLLKNVKIFDKRYHEVSLATPEEFDKVLVEQKGLLNVKQKAGCLSHREDPVGFRSLTAQVLTQDTSFHWSLTASSALLSLFTSEPGVSCFAKAFVQDKLQRDKCLEILGSLLYECASHEKLDLLPFWISTFQLQWQLNRPGHCFVGAQLELIEELARVENELICPEIITSVTQSLKAKMNKQAKKTTIKDLATLDTVHANLVSFSGLDVLALQGNLSAKSPLHMINNRCLSGRAVHTLAN